MPRLGDPFKLRSSPAPSFESTAVGKGLATLALLVVGSGFGAELVPSTLPDAQPLAPNAGGVGNWDAVISAEIERATAARPQRWRRDLSFLLSRLHPIPDALNNHPC